MRAYRRGDPLKLVAWKKAAQALETGAELVSRDTSDVGRQELWLDWTACGTLAPEERLSRLAAWTLPADRAGTDYGLRLPGRRDRRPTTARRSAARCLEALALWHGMSAQRLPQPLRLPHWPGWHRLPREARDTLFLLAVIAWIVLPHAAHLPRWYDRPHRPRPALARPAGARATAPLPSRWVLVARAGRSPSA